MSILKPRSKCTRSSRCVPVKQAGKSDKPQNSPFPPPPPHTHTKKNDCIHNCRQSPCRFSGSTTVSLRCTQAGVPWLYYGCLRWRPGDSVMSRCFPVLKIIASGEKHNNTGMYRDTTESNLGSPWTFSVFGFRLESSD